MSISAALLLCAFAAPADEVELTTGAVVEGRVEDLGDSIRVTRPGLSIVYPKHMVRRVTPKKTDEEVYQERSRSLGEKDLEGRLSLARWCLQKKLPAQAAQEYRKILALDPEHEEARTALGYRRHEGRWVTEDEYHEARGLVRHKGRWMTPEEKALDVALEEQKELDRRISEQVRNLLDRTRSSDEKARLEAIEALARIDDRYKAKFYLAALTSPSRHTRRFVYEELGRMKEPAAARPLARRALWDEDEDLRPVALAALRAIAHPDTALYFVPFLGEESVSARLRCLEAMTAFPDRRAAPYLVQALENSIEMIQQAESLQPLTVIVQKTMVLRDGTVVRLPQVRRIPRDGGADRELLARLREEKAAVATALRAATGQDFGEDPARWRAWLQKSGKD
ncbi:MAG TPA: HEAT repeat domain-containing protein [Planctomycetota bacterium]|nr:HEAT repeat domain-containing protein [Planctomycetota bacterium]